MLIFQGMQASLHDILPIFFFRMLYAYKDCRTASMFNFHVLIGSAHDTEHLTEDWITKSSRSGRLQMSQRNQIHHTLARSTPNLHPSALLHAHNLAIDANSPPACVLLVEFNS